LATEAVVPALDPSGRGRGEVGRAAERFRVAIALEERTPRLGRLRHVGVEAGGGSRIARLRWGIHKIARQDPVIAGPPEADRDMARRVAGCRHEADVIA